MSFEIDVAFVEQYRSNILLLSQQKMSRLRTTCQEESVVGRTFYGERVGDWEDEMDRARKRHWE